MKGTLTVLVTSGQRVFQTTMRHWLLPGQPQSASKLVATRQKLPSSSPMGLGKHRWLTVVTDQKLTWSTTLDNAVLTPNHLSEKS